MKSIVRNLLLLFGAALIATSCKDPQPQPGGGTPTQGAVGVSQPIISVNNSSRIKSVAFVAFDQWTVSSDAKWCEIAEATLSGETGSGLVRFALAQNETPDVDRTAIITISVAGFPVQKLCTITQSKSGGEVGGRAVNRWVSDYMASSYLWNEDFGNVENRFDYDVKPQDFLTDALSSMRDNGDDGGSYANGQRFYYTYLREGLKPQSAPTRSFAAAPLQGEDLGIKFVYPVIADDKGTYYFQVAAVFKDSPADIAGIKRGMYVTQFNGKSISATNLEEIYAYLMAQAPVAKADLRISQFEKKGTEYELTDKGNFSVNVSSYDKNPIIYSTVAKFSGTGKAVAYMVLSDFDASHDYELLNIFDVFKSHNATDLILDLRYNGGGDVYSSAVLATLAVGNAYKDQVYSLMEYNELRKKAGKEDYFYIGKDPSVGPYAPITEALNHSLNLSSVYVLTTGFTASASELVINGLRGLGLNVYTVGATTEGKNVGMEVIVSASAAYKDYNFGDYIYEFAPITFYNKNAQGFKDYGDGFVPNFVYEETKDLIFDWEEGVMTKNDMLFYAACKHIQSGSWPVAQSAPATRAADQMRVDAKHRVLDGAHSRGTYIYPNEFYTNR